MDFDSLPEDAAPEATAPKFDDLPEDPGSGSSALGAFAQKAFSTATTGLGTLAETAIPSSGRVYGHGVSQPMTEPIRTPEAIQTEEAEHPVASFLGSAAGIGALFPAAGAVGELAGTAGMGVTTGLARGAATKAALTVAGEGAALGAGNAMNDYALGDPNLNAQKIMSEIGQGVFWNFGAAGLGKAAEAVVPGAAALVGKGLSKITDAIQEGIEAIPGQWAETMRMGMENAGKNTQNFARKMSDNLVEIYHNAEAARKELYEKYLIPGIKQDLNELSVQTATDSSYPLIRDARNLHTKMMEEPQYSSAQVDQYGRAVDKLENKFNNAKSASDVHDAIREFTYEGSDGIKYDKNPDGSVITPQEITQKALRDMNIQARNHLKNPEVWGSDAANRYATVSDAAHNYYTAKDNFEQGFMSTEWGPKGFKVPIAGANKMKSFFSNIADMSQDTRNRWLNEYLDSVKNLTEMSTNGATLKDAQESLMDKFNRFAQSHKEYTDVAKALSKRAGPSNFDAAAAGVAMKLEGATTGQTAATMTAVKAMRYAKDPYTTGEALGSTFNTIGAASRMLKSASGRMASTIKSIFSSAPVRGSLIQSQIQSGDYDKNVKRIEEMSKNPQAMLNHLTKSTDGIYAAMPNVTSSLHTTAINGLNFLASKIPQPKTQFALSGDFEPSEVQKDQFNDYYNIVNDPMLALDAIKEGSLSNFQIEALQAVYPHLLTEMQSQIAQHMNPKKADDLPYGVKLSLAKFLSMPLDGSMTKPALAANQAQFMVNQQGPGPGPAPKDGRKSTLGGLKELDVANRAETQSDRLAKEET